ncbi:CPBP family intramembrane glutamic endopeptidase [Erythrobacter sp. SD-21]|uniref:CPBP family intramembrane glutamic endopeptidase n=1 Tax=Erythrobacter sp. SD-21 TaxID=161528 RepID=UPI000153EFD5|nr:CPBP family intramembrane glutamic endopeptidase [Erythrobacter sp. SD-21]EDL47843.1 hypothetical protein ED21_22078 [Erythrobacter sp. SD-21]
MISDDRQRIGWGYFILQMLTIGVVYFACSIPAAAIWGELDANGQATISSTGAAVSVASSMVGGLLVAWLWLRRDGALAQAWNLRTPPEGWPRTLLVAVLATVAIIGWFTLGAMLAETVGLAVPDVEEVLGWVTQSRFHFMLWIVLVALFAAGLGEELLWRGYLMDRLERLPGLAGKAWPIIIIQGALFGLPHAYQGWGGMIITGVVGLGLGWLRYNRGGNLWALVLAHMAVDVIMMSLAYADRLSTLPPT